MFKDKILELSKDQEWNHQYYLPDGSTTREKNIDSHGYNIQKWPRIKSLSELAFHNCKTFIDVGCSDGYYCIELAKLNEKFFVTGIDIDKIRINRANFIKNIYGLNNLHFYKEDLYNLINDNNKFDFVMGLGLLHRVPDLNRCVEDLCYLSKRYILFEFKCYKAECDAAYDHGGMTKSNKYNRLYKTPSIIYIKNRLEEFGFKTIGVLEGEQSLKYPRVILLGEKSEQSL